MVTRGERRENAVPDAIVDWVEQLHTVVDELAAPVVALHSERLRCRQGCSGCCSDGLTVFEIEAAVIARRHEELLTTGEPHPEGACAFLDEEGACRIYEERPYVCRTQGLPLRWLEEDEDGATVEMRDICPLNHDAGPPLEELTSDACWTIGPIEERLAARQGALGSTRGHDSGLEAARVALRALFTRSASPADGKRHLPLSK